MDQQGSLLHPVPLFQHDHALVLGRTLDTKTLCLTLSGHESLLSFVCPGRGPFILQPAETGSQTPSPSLFFRAYCSSHTCIALVDEAITCSVCTAGLVSRLGVSGMPSLTEAALQTLAHRPELPQALLQQAYAVDQQAVKLLTQRQQGVLAGVAGLQAYSAALRLLLPDGYADSTHHSRWAQAIGAAVNATDTQVQPLLMSGGRYFVT